MNIKKKKIAASFRDPSGFVFVENGRLYREVNSSYAESYEALMRSGLYEELKIKGMLVAHREVGRTSPAAESYKRLEPERIPFVSYPYEWCFSELKDAALLTLKIQKTALRYGMWLKDAPAYNIQFRDGRPILIDTLSFEKYREGLPWVAYRQFCEHFLAPLALMSFSEVRLGQLLRIYPDGLPLDFTSALLPLKSWFSPAAFFHLHLHAKSQERFSQKSIRPENLKFSRASLEALVESLESGVASLKWRAQGTRWADYYDHTNYSAPAFQNKLEAVSKFVARFKPALVWDLGANEGLFSRAASEKGIETVAFDVDPAAVERNYLAVKRNKEKKLLPLLLDLTNPSPAVGWANKERASLIERGPADLALALALVHHLAISNNVPFAMMAEFFSRICRDLVVEFVPKSDSQVQRLLKNRADIFSSYSSQSFEREFGKYFEIKERYRIPASERVLYAMKARRRGL